MSEIRTLSDVKQSGLLGTSNFDSIINNSMQVLSENPELISQRGMDIGDTLIGMHLKDLAVPVRLSVNKIGEAHLVCARTRAKYIGGERAHYDEKLS